MSARRALRATRRSRASTRAVSRWVSASVAAEERRFQKDMGTGKLETGNWGLGTEALFPGPTSLFPAFSGRLDFAQDAVHDLIARHFFGFRLVRRQRSEERRVGEECR